MRAPVLFAMCAAAALFAGRAGAQPQVSASEKDQLVQEIAHDYEALSSGDCAVACKAFASMQRAAERLCGLDPGPACDDARAKVEEARRRVRASCPTCVVETPLPTPRPAPPAPEAQAASAPPSESKRGGCAGCSVGPADLGDFGAAGLAFAVFAGTLRAPRRRRRR